MVSGESGDGEPHKHARACKINANFGATSFFERTGDIRAAICAVEMFKQHNGAIDLKFLNGEDPQVEMFHLIGKILYAKRDDKPSRAFSAAQSKLNANVRNDYRRYLPPKDQPERLVRSWPVNTPTVCAPFLPLRHQKHAFQLIDYVAEHELRLCKSARRTTRAYRDLCSMAQLNRIWLLRNDAIADRLMTQVGRNLGIFSTLRCFLFKILIYSLAFNNSDVARGKRRRFDIKEDDSIYTSILF